jgi:hypothetical protein
VRPRRTQTNFSIFFHFISFFIIAASTIPVRENLLQPCQWMKNHGFCAFHSGHRPLFLVASVSKMICGNSEFECWDVAADERHPMKSRYPSGEDTLRGLVA